MQGKSLLCTTSQSRFAMICPADVKAAQKASPMGKLSPQATDEVICLRQMLILEPQAISLKLNLIPRVLPLGELAKPPGFA